MISAGMKETLETFGKTNKKEKIAMLYADIAASFRAFPRDVPTAPINGNTPKWFYAYESQGEVYVSSGRKNSNACHIHPDRKLPASEFPVMLSLYLRRKAGEPVSREASRQSTNQSYWYGIFHEMSL